MPTGGDLLPGALDGRVALVSGASRGIGREIAVALARSGADIAGLARSQDALADLGTQVKDLGRRFLAVPADVTEVEALDEVVGAVEEWGGRLDCLVNAAGMMIRAEPLDITPSDWDQVFAVNTRAAYFLSQAVGRRMLAADGGSIINVASLSGQITTGASVVYSASKAALAQMSRVLAVRWAPHVRVNAVGPGYIRTDLNSEWLDVPENLGYVLAHTPLGRAGLPADVAGLVVFLASPHAAYITGQHLLVDGGWSAQ
ncbi:MAG: SDR family NAD(P)-dependent oxidoreductase [Streptosporangiales bacterium]